MKTKIVSLLLLLGLATTAMAMDPSELDGRIRMLSDKFDEFQHQPVKAIPPEMLRKAKGIMLLDRTKAGFLFAYQGGKGVAMVRDMTSGQWSPAAFVDANEASLGFQIGGEQHFVIVLFMTTNSTRMLLDQTIAFAGEARGTAGNDTKGVQTGTPLDRPILVYDDREGLFGGAAIKGGAIKPDDEANHVYYGQFVTMSDILFDHKVQRSEAATRLTHEIDRYAHIDDVSAETSKR